MTRGQAKPEKLSTRVPFAGLFDLKRLRQSSVFRHQMPPKAKPTTSAVAAASSSQTKDADIDVNKVVSFGALKTYMDSVIQKVNANTDARFEKLTDEFNGQKKELSTVQKTNTDDRFERLQSDSRAKNELILSNGGKNIETITIQDLDNKDINDMPKPTKETVTDVVLADGKIVLTPTVTNAVYLLPVKKGSTKKPPKFKERKTFYNFCYTVLELSSMPKKVDEIIGPPSYSQLNYPCHSDSWNTILPCERSNR